MWRNTCRIFLLIDFHMPRMDGIDAIREIKRHNAGIRALVLTVHKSEEYLREALEAGADGDALKDTNLGQLLIAVDSVLAAIAQGRNNREIADRIYVSVKTVEKHRANLMKSWTCTMPPN